MIPPKLEELIWDGKARYGTWTVGTSAAGLIVPKNKTIVIIGFDYYPFIDAPEEGFGPGDAADYRSRMNKVIILSSKNKRYQFLARNYFEFNQGVRPDAHFFRCYAPFIDNISLAIANIPSPATWTIVSGAAPRPSEQPTKPLSYGNEANKFAFSPQSIDLGDASSSEVRPFADRKVGPGTTISFEQFGVAVEADTVGINPVNNLNNVGAVQFPFITVHYVEVNEKTSAKFL